MMRVLGIETSCDETAVAIYDIDQGLLSHAIYSQVDLHTEFGGVVPELASRDHVRKLLPLITEVLNKANLNKSQLDGIAYTAGPGLVGALLVGAMLARSLAWGLQIPAIGIHHLEGHLLAPMLEAERPEFPFLCLLVSGGHTLLVEITAVGQYKILGESLDDAAGEAFDKTAKILGLPYPGGPVLAKLAENGNPQRFSFPRPMLDKPNLDFSFSGLKTSVLHTWQASAKDEQTKADIAYAFQEAVVETLIKKCFRALTQTGLKRLVVAGGVGANQRLRQELKQQAAAKGIEVFFPRIAFCTDNGAMIAYAGAQRLKVGQQSGLNVQVLPRWPLNELSSL